MRVSLVVPLRNEEETIESLIRGIRDQSRAPDEVVLVDGGSTDGTVALARRLTGGDRRFRLLEAGPATPGRGRNVGIAAATNDWIALTDAGIQPESTWLERLVDVPAKDPSVRVVYGNFEPIARSFFERCAALAYPTPRQERPGGRMRGPSIGSTLLRREVWEAAGGFPDLRNCEDLIFRERVGACGVAIGWAPTATVWWRLEPSLARTFRKFVMYARNSARIGRTWDWHRAIALKYLMGLPFVLLAVSMHPAWLAFPGVVGCVRVAKSIWRRREIVLGDAPRWIDWVRLGDPVQFLGVALVLITLDLATFVGWIQSRR